MFALCVLIEPLKRNYKILNKIVQEIDIFTLVNHNWYFFFFKESY